MPGTWESYRWSLTTKVGFVADVDGGRYDVAGSWLKIDVYRNEDSQKWHVWADGIGIVALWIRTA
ncbi:hypothetical protein [Slackia isoflavoniconvertens]|uniref:Ricin B lectin domain-containing protein n=1 Tax=Slackia isoflavoniconvertens TaxID=572010 RepID=A0A3N0IAZ6_9ACTN|nr:hypothetical protein [Slackia isoflavoniconvertens]MBB3279778.1 hypothetical protein [Slackia isoflavoniconvertens]RNM33532.1 hypothetical protein DMP05_08305 [Slackia isoflavoniconvertens]